MKMKDNENENNNIIIWKVEKNIIWNMNNK